MYNFISGKFLLDYYEYLGRFVRSGDACDLHTISGAAVALIKTVDDRVDKAIDRLFASLTARSGGMFTAQNSA